MEDMFKQSIQYLCCNTISPRYYTHTNLFYFLSQEIPLYSFGSCRKCFTAHLNSFKPVNVRMNNSLISKIVRESLV